MTLVVYGCSRGIFYIVIRVLSHKNIRLDPAKKLTLTFHSFLRTAIGCSGAPQTKQEE